MEARGRSVLVALDPVVLEGALAVLIGSSDDGEVVQFHASSDPLSRQYDAAVVSSPPPEGIHARVVICLPPEGAGETSVTESGATRWTLVRSHRDVIRLLEGHPG